MVSPIQKLKQQSLKHKAIQYLGGKKCNNPDCQNDWYPLASYDFHHIKGAKEDNISKMLSQRVDWDKIKIELDKCVVLCAGCHRMFHFLKVKIYKEKGTLVFIGLH